MKTTMQIIISIALAVFVIDIGIAASPDQNPPKPPKLSGNHPIVIDGTATMVGQWACGGDVNIQATPDPSEPPAPGLPSGVQITAVAAVPAIDCGDSTMNKHMRKALKDKDFPEIRFKSDKYTLLNNGKEVRTAGELTIAGVTRPVEIDAKLMPLPGGGTRVTGKVNIDMDAFGVKPPSLFLGAMKVAKTVSVNFDTTIKLPNQAAQ